MTNAVLIHPTAMVSNKAKLGTGVNIGPYAVVGDNVELHDFVKVHPHGVVSGHTIIGEGSQIWPFASIGTDPQDLKYKGEDTVLVCGKRNNFREYSNVSIGTVQGGGKTLIGDDNLFMMNVHVAHDCIIGNRCVLANSVSLAGHVEVGDSVVIGGYSGCHQFTKFGDFVMVGAGSIVVQDVPPYCTVHGNHAEAKGLNLLGLKRGGFSKEDIDVIKMMYQFVFREHLTLEKAILRIEQTIPNSPIRQKFVSFLQKATRGVCR